MTDLTFNAVIDIDALTAPLDDTAPCGENLEYDPQYLVFEEAVRGKPEVQYGATITPATPPDWPAVYAVAIQLMGRSRDLRLAVPMTRALTSLHTERGLATGMRLVSELLSRYWDGVHPQLDADDGNDPTERVNIVSALCQHDGMLKELREMPLVRVRALGSVCLRDIELAASVGEGGAPDGQMSAATIMAIFAQADQPGLSEAVAALAAAATSARDIEQLLVQNVGVGGALDLTPLIALMERARETMLPYVQTDSVDEGAAQEAHHIGAERTQPASRAGEITSRADVTRTLDALCTWYAEQEPSSPVPLLLQRAHKLVNKSFTELMQELAPEGLSQLALISGTRAET